MKAGKSLIMITLLLMSLNLIAGVSVGKVSVTDQISNSVSTSATMSHGDWSQTYGGSGDDYAYSVVQTSDGGFALAGFTDSSGAGGFDFNLVKTDSAGNMNWSQTYGGSGDDFAYSLIQTSDGGYALAGYTDSSGAGYYDFYLVKTDAAGNMQWNMTYGGVGDDEAYSLIQTGDGGYVLAGSTSSSSVGVYNFWLVKTYSNGTEQWSQTYGSTGDSEAYAVIKTTADGGYALEGFTDASGAGGYDVWLVKTDSTGAVLWSQTYGGSSDDFAYSLIQTSDSGYALAGYTDSSGAGGNDFYLVKVDSSGASSSSAGFNWSSIEGYVIIAAIAIIVLAAVMLIISRIGGRKGKF